MTTHTDRSFWWITVAIAVVLITIVNAPMLRGRVPLPTNFFFSFPLFAADAPADAPTSSANVGDLITSFYPFRTLTANAARNGEVPLWDPHLLSGTPLIANGQTAVFYPPNVFYNLLPVALAWSVGFVLRPLLAILFMAAFLRSMGATKTGSIAAALLFAFCGFMTVWQGQAMADAAIWLPLICLSVVLLHSEQSMRHVVLASIAFAMPVLAGHPETAAHLTLTGTALAAYLFVMKPSRRFAFCFIAAGLSSFGLAAIQIFPTVEWIANSHRSLNELWPALPLWSLTSFVSRDILKAESASGLLIPEQAAFIGMMCFVAAPLALLHRSRKLAVFFCIIAAIALCGAWGIWPVSTAILHTPVLRTLKNTRLILIASFAAALLAGLGISAAETELAQSGKQRLRAALLVIAGTSVGLILVYVLRINTSSISQTLRFPRISGMLLIASAALILMRLAGRLSNWQFQILVILSIAFDVATFSRGYLPFSKPADIFPQNELFERLKRENPEPFRVTQLNAVYGANFEAMYGVDAVTGYDVILERTKTFLLDLTTSGEDSVTFSSAQILPMRDRRLDMLNSKYYIVTQWDPRYLEFRNQPDRFRFLFSMYDTDVIENLNVLPRAFVVPASGIEVIADDKQALLRVKDPAFDPERSVVLGQAVATTPGNQTAPSTVQWTSRRDNSFQLKVNAGQPGVLVVSQIFYPGWKAFVDGKPVPVMPANYALTAVTVDAGNHDVQFVFDPASFKIGWIVSLTTLAGLVLAAFFFNTTEPRPGLAELPGVAPDPSR